MSQDKRMDKIAGSLTPKQAVVLWLREVQQYGNPYDYIQAMRGLPESARPIPTIADQVERAVREDLKGRKDWFVEAAVRRAVRDVVFLLKLRLQVNFKIMSEQRAWDLMRLALAESLHGMIVEDSFRTLIGMWATEIDLDIPYPLDPDMAASVDAAVKHSVTTWEQLDQDGTVGTWLFNHLVAQGATDLPEHSYELRDGEYCPRVEPDNEKEIRACFKEEAEFEKFHSGKDYSYGLADVPDAEYNAHYETMVSAMHELVDSGKVQAGTNIRLDTVPVLFLQDAPLVKGDWLDRDIVVLAEWSKLLMARGYKTPELEDRHPLAVERFVRKDGKDADPAEVQALRQKASQNLAKFPDRTKKINGRPYLHLEHYSKWPPRKVKGNLRSNLQHGFVTASWNEWVKAQGGEREAIVAGVPVSGLHCYAEHLYYSSQDGAKEQHRREKVLDSMRDWRRRHDGKEDCTQDWRKAAERSLIELYSFQDAVNSINQRYFDGCPVLFPDLAEDLAGVIEGIEESVGRFNVMLANETEPRTRVELDRIRNEASKGAPREIAYFVDMAKVEALDALGEEQAAMELAERHL